MNPFAEISLSRDRIFALLALALMIVAPVLWVIWSLSAASQAAETAASQSELVSSMRAKLAELQIGPETTGSVSAGSIYLSGETQALAGASLQKLIVETIQGAGGRVTETEFAPVEATEGGGDPGRIDVRASFDAETDSLQSILFDLESRTPLLLVRALTVQSVGAAELPANVGPPLRVIALVGGFMEPAE